MKWRPFLIVFLSLFILFLLVVAFVMGAATGSSGDQGAYGEDTIAETDSSEETTKLKFVKTDLFKAQTYGAAIQGLGRVSSSQAVSVTSEVQGALQSGEIILKKGSSFSKGQLLFRVNSSDAALLLAARKSTYLTLLANILPDLKVDYPDHYEVWKLFFDNIDIEGQLPPIPPLIDSKLKTFLAAKNVLGEYYSIRADQVRLAKYSTRAPFNGTVVDAFSDVGSIVNPGSPVINIINNGALEVECQIKPDESRLVRIGANVLLSDEKGKVWKGKVMRKGQYLNPNTQSIPVFVELAGNAKDVYNGMYLSTSIESDSIPNVFEVPRSALLGNQSQIYVVQDSLLSKREIDIVLLKEETVLIGGLTDDEMVVIEPIINPREGMKVGAIKD